MYLMTVAIIFARVLVALLNALATLGFKSLTPPTHACAV